LRTALATAIRAIALLGKDAQRRWRPERRFTSIVQSARRIK